MTPRKRILLATVAALVVDAAMRLIAAVGAIERLARGT